MPHILNATTLPNGIIVATDHAPHFEGAAIQATFKVGSMYETDAQSGIAHLLEHLVFRGSETRSGDNIQAAFAALGGEINATTDEDTTAFHAKVLHEGVGEALDLLGDMLARPKLEEEHIRLEQQIVEQENCNGCWNCTMREIFLESAYPGHPVARPIIGHEKTVNALTRDDIAAFHAAAYQTGALTVVVAGNVRHEEIVARVETAFAGLPQGSGLTAEPLVFTPGEALLSASGDHGVLRFGFPDPMTRDRASRARSIWLDIVGGHGNSLLMRELREKHGLVYGIGGGTWGIADRDIHAFNAQGDIEKMEEIVTRTADVMHAAAENLDTDEVEAAKRRMKATQRMGLDEITDRCGSLSASMVYFGSPFDPDERERDYATLETDEVLAQGRHVLSQPPVLVAYGSTRSMPKFPAIREQFTRAPAAGKEFGSEKKKRGLFRLAG